MTMKCFAKILFCTVIGIYSSLTTAQTIVVDDAKNAKQLVEDILVNSPCVTVSNFTVNGDSFSGSSNSYGYFNNQGGSFPIKEGIVLSTWSSINSVGSFVENRGGGDTAWLGDTDLEQALGISNTKNATAIEFDFKAETDFISFNYIFASNEYQYYFPCQFSDGFAFLIKEKGSSEAYRNIAVLPNSTTIVSSTTIHPSIAASIVAGVPIPGCPAVNEQYFNGYNNNTSAINYSGQTTVLNAKSSVDIGKTYHIKLVIADHRNNEFDSAVFIEAGSFAPKINLGPDQIVCFNEKTILNTGLTNNNYTYEWFKDGGITSIGSTSTLEIDSPGTYSVNVSLAAGCVAVGKVKINYKSPLLKTLTQCGDSSGTALFDLTQITSSANISNNNNIKYFSNLLGAEITNPNAYESTAKTVYARITNTASECLDFVQISLQVLTTSTAIQNLTFCDNDVNQDGIRRFNLKKEVDLKVVPLPSGSSIVEGYYSVLDDAVMKQNKLNNTYTNIPNQTIFVRVENGTDCYGIYQINLNVTTYTNSTTDLISDVIINDFSGNNSVEIKTIGTGPFEYSLDGSTFQDNAMFTDIKAGEYTVYVRDNFKCELSKKQIYVLDYPRFFTPNGDGYNDLWKIKNLYLYNKAIITIFDRYGKLLKQLNASSSGWNGNYNGIPLPADDYWFNINLVEKNTIKGHFTLKR